MVYILGTGFLGYLTNKVLPNLLNRFDEEIIYERIPIFRQKISEDIENTINLLIEQNSDENIIKYYINTVYPWLSVKKLPVIGLYKANQNWRQINDNLLMYETSTFTIQSNLISDLRLFVRKKYEIDIIESIQFLLKHWLIIHAPPTIILLILILIHAAISHAYRVF